MERSPLTDLYERLASPPIGPRAGPMPIVFLTALRVFADEVALYEEDGMFVPSLREELVERLARNPQDFWVQRLRIDPARRELIRQLANVLGAGEREAQILDVVRPLVLLVAKLPRFSKRTKTLSAEACRLREIALRTKDPAEFLFREIPIALGLSADRPDPRALAKKTRSCLIELEQALPRLLDRLGDLIIETFGLPREGAAKALSHQAWPLAKLVVEAPLRQFVLAAARLDGGDWRIGLARSIQRGKTPDTWSDHDVAEFGVRLSQVHRQFERVKELAAAAGEGSERVLRIDLLADRAYSEHPTTVIVSPDQQEAVDQAADQLLEQLEEVGSRLGISGQHLKAVLSHALVRRLNEDSVDKAHAK